MMHKLELRIPPPVILLICGLMARITSARFSTSLDFEIPLQRVISVVLVACGVLIAGYAILSFRREQTTVDPINPDNAATLVTSGVFRYTRNPMYTGMLLVLTAWVVYLGSASGALSIVLFVAYITYFQIRPEERILAAKFGESYTDYRKLVRRWL